MSNDHARDIAHVRLEVLVLRLALVMRVILVYREPFAMVVVQECMHSLVRQLVQYVQQESMVQQQH